VTGRARVLLASDLIEIDPFLFQFHGIVEVAEVKTESALNSAVHFVLSERVAKAVILTGYEGAADEYALHRENIINILTTANYETSLSDLRTEPLPDDADLLVLLPPSSDLSTGDIGKLEAFFARADSNTAAVLFTAFDGRSYPVFDEYLRDWGFMPQNQLILDTQLMFPLELLPVLENHSIFGNMENTPGTQALVLSARPLEILWHLGEHRNRKIERIMHSSQSSYARDASALISMDFNKTGGDTDGPFTLGVLGWQSNLNAGTIARLAVLPLTLISPEPELERFANRRIMLQVCNYFSPSAYHISIPAKIIEDPPMIVKNAAVIWILLLSLPVLFVVLGTAVWIRRRNR
jgi:hypothetical protein